MGVVFEAEDLKLGRHVALKMLAGSSADPVGLERFWREARTASALNHPGICTLYEINDSEMQPFLVMEMLEGDSLDRLYRGQAMPMGKLIELGVQVADALDTAHRKGILHRDIKPGNIFLTVNGQAKILDFGLARFESTAEESEAATRARHMLTTPGSALGTIAYMSPEQARGEMLDVRSDIFSLGVVLYEMGTGRHPFEGTTTAVVFDKLLNYHPTAPLSLNDQMSAEFEVILNKALEKDRDLRYQSAADVRADLKRLQRGISPGRTFGAMPSIPANPYEGMTRVSSGPQPPAPAGSGAISASAAQLSSAGGAPAAVKTAGSADTGAAPAPKPSETLIRPASASSPAPAAPRVSVVPARSSVSPPPRRSTDSRSSSAPSIGSVSAARRATSGEKTQSSKDLLVGGAVIAIAVVLIIAGGVWGRVTHENDPGAGVGVPVAASGPVTPNNPDGIVPDRSQAGTGQGSSFAPVSFTARHLHTSGGSCTGTLQLTATRLIYTSSSHKLNVTRAQVHWIDGESVIEPSGQRWRFAIVGMTPAQAHAELEKWYAAAPVQP